MKKIFVFTYCFACCFVFKVNFVLAQNITKHMTANETNADGSKAYLDTNAIGFDIHDTGMNTSVINSLPTGSMAMVWVGVGAENCSAVLTQTFKTFVTENATNSKLFGFYLTDEPLNSSCVEAVTVYTKFIHDNAPGKKSFILLTDWPGTYAAYRPEITKVDLIGLDPYPVKDHIVTSVDGNYSVSDIPKEVNNAIGAGIPLSAIVPVFQTFGSPSSGGYQGWGSPTSEQLNRILSQWMALVPNPQLDYAYSWGLQDGGLGDTLSNRADWRSVMAVHNSIQSTLTTVLGDTNTDGKVDLVDFGNWKNEYLGKILTKTSDFNNDSEVDLVDFGIWKVEYLKM